MTMLDGTFFDKDDPPQGFCPNCGDECSGILIDVGIGPYEYWGSCGVDTQLVWVSPCCEEDLSTCPPKK